MSFYIQVTIKKSSNFYECEKNIRGALNEGGSLATGKCLEDFDADGSPIVIEKRKLTTKRTKISRKYETPYGVSTVNRYAYQGSEGGAVFYPMEANSRIVGGSTPSFAQSVSYLVVLRKGEKQTISMKTKKRTKSDISGLHLQADVHHSI